MSNTQKARFNAQAAEEAAEFFVEFRAGDSDSAMRLRFSEWLRMSPEHVRAYLDTAAIWNHGSSLDKSRRYAEADLIALARADGNVIPWDARGEGPGAAPAQPAPGARRIRRQAMSAVFGIAASLAIVALAELTMLAMHRGTYSTDIGEQRSIVLADGSTVELNSRSKIRVHYTETGRAVDLLAGQALFKVAKDKNRPFVVRSSDVTVRAVGTEFDVYQRRLGTVVTVIEGRVWVRSGAVAAADAGPYLTAGEQLTIAPTSGTLPRPVHANLAAATAWTQRQLVFDSASLADVAEEINRYNTRQLIIDDVGLNDFHISGVFSSTDPASLLRFLRSRPDINVRESGDVIHVSSR